MCDIINKSPYFDKFPTHPTTIIIKQQTYAADGTPSLEISLAGYNQDEIKNILFGIDHTMVIALNARKTRYHEETEKKEMAEYKRLHEKCGHANLY